MKSFSMPPIMLLGLALIVVTLVPVSDTHSASKDIISLQARDLPGDVVAVSNVILGTMRHRSDLPSNVEIVAGARQMLQEPGFQYKGFNVSQYYLLGYRPVGKEKEGRHLKLALRFDDEIGRSAAVVVSTIYRQVGEVLRIEYASVREQHPVKPTIQLFAVPSRKFPKKIRRVAGSFEDLYRFALKNAVPIQNLRKVSSKKRKYVILAFAGERMPPGAKLDLVLDSQAEGLSGSSHGMRRLDYMGWQVVSLPINLALKKSPAYFLKAVLTPGPKAPAAMKGPLLLASYATSDGPPSIGQLASAPNAQSTYPVTGQVSSNIQARTSTLLKLSGQWHVDRKFGFKIKVPKGWQSQALQDGTDRVLTVLSPDGNVAARVRAIPVPGGVAIDKVLSAFEQYALSGGKRLSKQNDSLNGLPGVVSVYSGKFEGTEVGMAAFTTLQGRHAYILWGMIPLAYFDQRSAEVDAILNSFTLL